MADKVPQTPKSQEKKPHKCGKPHNGRDCPCGTCVMDPKNPCDACLDALY